MLYAERHRPRGVGLAGAVHRTWAVAEKNDWQFSNPRIDTGLVTTELYSDRCYLATGPAVVSAECDGELSCTQHAHGDTHIWNPHWGSTSQLEVCVHLNL